MDTPGEGTTTLGRVRIDLVGEGLERGPLVPG